MVRYDKKKRNLFPY